MTTAATSRSRPAELDRRFYAFVADRILTWTLDAALGLLAVRLVGTDRRALAVLAVVAVVLGVGGVLAVVAGRTGATPGRALAGVRLLDARTGRPIGVSRAVARQAVLGVAALPTLGLGLAALAWTAVADPGGRRRGWHDRVAGSEVVDDRPVRAAPPDPDRDEEAARPDLVNLTALRLVPAGDVAVTPQAGRSPAARGPAAGPGPGQWCLEVDTGETIAVTGTVLVGRDPQPRPGEDGAVLVALSSRDMSLSKTHARLRCTPEGGLVVVDRGSTNGSTLLRGGAGRELPTERPITLLAGDVIRVGDRNLRVTWRPIPRTGDESVTVG